MVLESGGAATTPEGLNPPVAILKALWEREALSGLELEGPDLCR
jgi:hypothetical protein